MALTLDELRERRKYIGSSDIPKILGVSPYGNATDVWYEKTGRTEIHQTSSRAADLGDRLERPLVDLVADRLEEPVEYNRRFHRNEVLSAQVDGWMTVLEQPIEAKALGLFNPRFDTWEWGREGSDEIPFLVLAQVSFSLLVTGSDVAHVSALLGGGLGHCFYEVPRHEGLIAEIEDRAMTFWTENVEKDVRPFELPSVETLSEVPREPGKIVEIPDAYPDRWVQIVEQEKLITEAKELVKTEVLLAMGDAEVGASPFGSFTYKADKRGRKSFRFKGGTT